MSRAAASHARSAPPPEAHGTAASQPAPRERILHTAAAAVAEHGYHGMSMRDLAKGAGMSLSNLYNYFASKEEILFAIQKEAFEVLVASAQEALAGVAEPEARLYVFISHHVRYVAENPSIMRVLVHEASSLPAAERAAVRQLKERYFGLARSIVQSVLDGSAAATPSPATEVDSLELDRITYNVFGMLNWLYGWYDPEVHGDPQTAARTIHRITLRGVLGPCSYQDPEESLDLHLDSVEARPLLGRAPTTTTGGRP